MSLLSMMEAKLPPGFRFHPRDDELVCDYLANKISASGGVISSSSSFFGERSPMINVDLNKCEPWDLPELACIGGGGGGGGGGKVEWYLFSLRDRKYSSGERRNRATASGYWKATGKDRHIKRKGLLVGMRKTLVFYQGRAPKGSKTHWVMHEFRIQNSIPTIKQQQQQQQHAMEEDWVLCRIFYKGKSRRADMISSKPPMGPSMHHHHHQTSYEDHTTCSSLPPLVPPAMPMPMPMTMTSLSVDKYISTFSGSAGTDQPPPAPLMSLKLQGPTYDRELQVLPCFSTNAFPAAAAGYMSSTEAPLPTPTNSQLAAAQHYFGSCSLLPPDHFGLNQLHYLDCDNKLVMIRAVLNQ